MSQFEPTNIQDVRDQYIRQLDMSNNTTQRAKELADSLFALDLTVYSNEYSFDSAIYSSFAKSKLDSSISLHPEQVQIINQIKNNNALIISAPTSFGKTFCVFEYIASSLPQNIVLIVPTLALVDEYLKRVIKKYHNIFSNYKIHTNIDEEKKYNFELNNIFIITHDRVVQESAYDMIEKIDFLVIDEVYKLETDPENDRVLVLNMAYYYLAKKANKYLLLAPFIKNVEDINKLEKQPIFYNTTYSPVVNDIKTIKLLKSTDRYPQCQSLLRQIPLDEKTLIYFPTVTGIYKYVNDCVIHEPILNNLNKSISAFVKWAKDEIHEDWSVIKAMERGYLIHNGQLPIGTRMFQLDAYENDNIFNRLLCTSTLLEGVNTIAKNIIITKPSRMSNKDNDSFSAFDFYNLVGRTGRLYKHYVGIAYYLKTPTDPEYKKIDAIKTIKFELTDDSKDISIQKGDIFDHPDVSDFLNVLGITLKDYLSNIGSRLRFETVLSIYHRFVERKSALLQILQHHLDNSKYGKLHLVKLLYYISENQEDPNAAFRSNLLNSLLDKRRPKIKSVVNNAKVYFKRDIDNIISTAIYIKMSYIEHQFYTKVTLIRYFMELSGVDKALIDVLDKKIINTIEYLYFSTSNQKKMLIDLGIYERDVDLIISIIGDNFDDTFELKKLLQANILKFKKISFISKYVIDNL